MSRLLNKKLVRHLTRLGQKKYRRQYREFMVEGIRLCDEILHSSYAKKALVFTPRLLASDDKQLIDRSQKLGLEIFERDEATLERISDTDHPQPAMIWAQMPHHCLQPDFFAVGRRFLALCNVSDPGNAGTLIRAAEAFGWSGILWTDNTTELYNPKVLRASMGSAFRMPISTVKSSDLLLLLQELGIDWAITVPKQGSEPPFASLPEKLVLFLGNEARGLTDDLIAKAPYAMQLPIASAVDSLNVAVAGSVFLYLLQ